MLREQALTVERNGDMIHTITLGKIICNCYLIEVTDGFIMIDTGRKKIKKLEKTILDIVGDMSRVKLIILTHGDFDHSGNAAYLQNRYKIPVAMHKHDSKMVSSGDMFMGRTAPNLIIKWFVNHLFKIDTFEPSLYIDEDTDLKNYAFNATVVTLPGHSTGSIGILTREGYLFCGDLYTNTKRPVINEIYDHKELMIESDKKVHRLNISRIYPGHGSMFTLEQLDNLM